MLAALMLAAGLQDAQAAFAREEYDQAERLALAEPASGASLYLAGLARFRAGRTAAALEAFDQAAQTADPPQGSAWHFNRGACLYQLNRFAEAEKEFLDAALDPLLAAVSLANAGFAALDAGSSERARSLAQRAQAADGTGAARELIADLEAQATSAAGEEYRAGISAYDAGRFDEARLRFRRAAELDPSDGRTHIMAGAAALRLGAHAEARGEFQQALSMRLDEEDARAARDYLDVLPRASWQGALTLGGGFDSNALQTGLSQPGDLARGTTGSVRSAAATGNLDLSLQLSPQARVAYDFDQLTYLSSDASDRSLQQHALAGTMEMRATDQLRLGGSLGAQLAFAGVSKFRGLQAAGGGSGWAILEESGATSTRLDLGFTRKSGLSEFGYLTGNRIDAGLSQELRAGSTTLSAGYWLRDEDVGTLQPALGPPQPFAYWGHTLWGSLRSTPLPRLRLEISGGFEFRRYADAADRSPGEIIRRADQRWFSSASASLQLGRGISLALRYDLVVNRSQAENGPPGTSQNQSFDKHAATLGTAFAW
jgi:tetratricopeptide (TPR) repeat protein